MIATRTYRSARRRQTMRARHLALALCALLASTAHSYEPDTNARKALSKTVKRDLIAATPGSQRLAVRLSFSTKVAFRDYEKLAKQGGYPPYADCSIATFVEITNWQIIQQRDVTPAQIAALMKRCQSSDETVLGPKPLSQEQGDREILRGMWQRNLAFVGRNLNDGALQIFITADANDKFSQLYGNASQWQLTANGFEPIASESTTTPTGASAPAPQTTPPQETAPPPPPSTPTQPPSTPTNKNIDRIALRTVTRYGLSGVYVENETYLLFKDGSILRDFSESPYMLNVAASQRTASKNWGLWRSLGQQLQVTWNGKDPQIWKKWFTTRPATRDQTIQGRFQSADGFGGGQVANFNTVALTSDGRFTWASLKGGDTGGWLPAYSDKRRAGRYELNGYSIRLRYNDGAVEDYAFCFYPKDNEHFVIGSNHFTPLD
ncbi:MAG: hypothetical protein AAFO81_03260 [Pseudomonadota bacterium]